MASNAPSDVPKSGQDQSQRPQPQPQPQQSNPSEASAAPPEGLNVGPAVASTSTTAAGAQGEASTTTGKKKKRRKKAKANRRQSFAVPNEPPAGEAARSRDQVGGLAAAEGSRPGFYRLGHSGRGNRSDESLSSEALLDHRYEHIAMANRCIFC